MRNSVYDKILTDWPGAPDLSDILDKKSRLITFSGENAVHTAVFPTDLSAWVRSIGQTKYILISLDEVKEPVTFDVRDSEQDYFDKLKTADTWNNEVPFPYAVRSQAYLGEGWILISDRDTDRMHLITDLDLSQAGVDNAVNLVRS